MTSFALHPSHLLATSARRRFGLAVRAEESGQSALPGAIAGELERLAEAGRRAITIVDFACGDGALLIEACRYARRLGFVVVDGQGFETRRWCLFKARRAARKLSGVAVTLTFRPNDREALATLDEDDCDIVVAGARTGLAADLIRLGTPRAAHFWRG